MDRLNDEQMEFAVENAMHFENLIQTPGWQALQKKAVEEVQSTMEGIFSAQETKVSLEYAKGYVHAIKTIMAFPYGMIEASNLSDEFKGKRLASRAQVDALTK